MLDLVGAELCDIGGKLGVIAAKLAKLRSIMLVDFGLDGVGAGERGLLRHERGRGAQCKSGNVPNGLQRGRANPAGRDHCVEALQVPLLLRRHAGDQLGFGAIAAEHRELAGVDACRAIFAGLVDAEHRCRVGTSIAGPPAAHTRRGFRVSSKISEAPPSDRIAFQPAMEMPRKRNCTSSHRTNGAWVIWLNSSAVVRPLPAAVHWVKPSKIFASTPA